MPTMKITSTWNITPWKNIQEKKLRVATKDFFQPRDVLNVINTPYIMFYFTCTYYYGLDKV